MAVIFEYIFDDTTGFRVVTLPNEELGREETVIQLRVSTGPNTVKMVKFALTDPVTQKDLYPLFEDAMYKTKLKSIGRKCETCGEYFLPSSPNQKYCPDCGHLKKEDS